ncbi:MAG: TerC family protein [Myxococcales bacterium]|nr:TerC family protein [Myxococcales bacterium]
MPFETIGSPLMWAGFIAFVIAMLAIDLGVFHRKAHEVTMKEAAAWSVVWVGLAILFNLGLYQFVGPQLALEFTAGYLIEKALAVDNIFVFVIIFSAFAIPPQYQHRVLFWGVLGALVMRAIFILLGGALLAKFHWMIYVFGGVLFITGIKLLRQNHETFDPKANILVRAFRKLMPVTDELHGDKFLVRQAGKWVATPLMMALVAVEFTDLIFAVDSIPAIYAVTDDPFIVFTSNIFAILGLRSLYFLLAGMIHKFAYLKTGLAFVLLFVGAKMLLMGIYKIPIIASLGVIVLILGASIVVSILRPPAPK